jgi:adenylate cyclase
VQRSGDRVRITVQLVYGASGKHLWANSYERDLRDAFVLERDVAQEIAKNIQTQLKTPKQRELPASVRDSG